ncbi:sensor histidine kinase [Streptomyces sp. NPDC059193]|uniref:sensor histidine kinase n=1 Tax=Streptomyces sp. NPDC059193 TaxID=3346763 RepID=UPI00369D1825
MHINPAAARRTADIVLGVGFAAAGCVAGAQYPAERWLPFDGWAYVLTVATALTLTVRRDLPVAVLLASCLGYAGYLALGHPPSLNFWVPVISLVSLAAQRPPRVARPAALLTAAVVLYSGVQGGVSLLLAAVQAVCVPAVALFLGTNQRTLAQRNADLARLTVRLARAQEEEAGRAVVDERIRIARELHDVLAQQMAVITVQSGLARYVYSSDPPTAQAALDAVAGAGRDALDELRRLLGVLRVGPDGESDAPPLRPLPGIDRIPELAERIEAAGVRVQTHTEGVVRPLGAGLELCAYRVVQESLTNVVKHAGATRAEVRIRYLGDRLLITIRDDGRGHGGGQGSAQGKGQGKGHGGESAATDTGSGLGLLGLRERVKIWNGVLSTGARPGGGFEVRLSLPLPSASRR